MVNIWVRTKFVVASWLWVCKFVIVRPHLNDFTIERDLSAKQI